MNFALVPRTGAAVFAFVLLALPVAAQAPPTEGPSTPRPSTERPSTEPPTGQAPDVTFFGTPPGVQLPGVLLPPRVGPDFLSVPPAQGRLTVMPSLTVSEEFNDNVFLSSANKRSDFITQFTPGVTLAVQQPRYRLMAGYNFTAEIYARDEKFSNAANRQQFLTALSYRATPVMTLNLSDGFLASRTSNAASISGISTGRQESWSNVFASGLDFRATPRATWHVLGAYTLERFGGPSSRDSNVYRIGAGVDYALTPRFSLTGGYDFAYLDIKRQPTSFAHTPHVGASYRVTPTLTAMLSGGPSFLVSDRDTTVSPTGTARLTQGTSWGGLSVFYDRAIATSGGFGGPSDNQTIGGSLAALTLRRGLVISFSPRYTISKSEAVALSKTDVKALTLNLAATYPIARSIAVVAAYTFFNQHAGGDTRTVDVDQNRVSVGLRFGYPINFY